MCCVPRMSYANGDSQVPLLGETMGENLRRTVTAHADREALVAPHQDYRATYGELWEQTSQVAKALIAQGVERGDRVGIWSPNRYEWVVVQYATARIGAVLVNVNPAYKASELELALNQAGVGMLLMSAGFRSTDYLKLLEQVRGRCPELRRVFVLADDWDELIDSGSTVTASALADREASLQFDDPINIQYTSGTTGSPKGATLSHHGILNNGYFVGRTLEYTELDRVCVPVPLYHCFGMVLGNLACTSHGAAIVLPGESFDASDTLSTIARERCTSVYGVPTMFIAMLEADDFDGYDLRSLRTGIMSGAPCPIDVMHRVQSQMHMTDVAITYGMTETSPVSTQSSPSDTLERRVTTVGRVHPHVEIKIIDPNGMVVPRGVSGELCTRGYSVMLGYWENAEATSDVIDVARWIHTGDTAVMDDDGYIQIVGRIKDMIIRGGENIYPREIEEFLHDHPSVSDVQVIGVASERYGEEVMAWVKPRAGSSLTSEELAAFCKGEIATYKIPTHWRIVDEFPMTVTGKVQKYRLREIAARELAAKPG